jgi:hypothetical protein
MDGLLQIHDDIVRVPFLVKGKVVLPPELPKAEIVSAFANAGDDDMYRHLGQAQVVRERIIDRTTMRPTDEWLYIVMPSVRAVQLLETDVGALAEGVYALTVDDICGFLEQLRTTLITYAELIAQVKEIIRRTSPFADPFLDWIFATLQTGLDSNAARQMIDRELSLWGKPGRDFLEGWVELDAHPLPDIGWLIAQNATWREHTLHAPAPIAVRAMPTRQLHITAGNSPNIPFVSALRLLLTKSVGVIKLPMNVTIAGGLFSLLMATATPNHPLVRHLSVVYWKGGDAEVEDILFQPNSFDRIVVWGAPGSVSAVQSRALFTKTVTFNPRYGVSIIGKREAERRMQDAESGNGSLTTENTENDEIGRGGSHLTRESGIEPVTRPPLGSHIYSDTELHQIAVKAGLDVMIYGQNACNASFVQYVEGDIADASLYGEMLAEVLAEWDRIAPPYVPPSVRGQIRRLRRSKHSGAEWFINTVDGEYTSAVVVVEGEFELLDHPLNRLVVVRPVATIGEVMAYLHAGVSTIGVYPETARLAWRDRLAATGVTNILPLGQCERLVVGMPHDGMVVLNQLVEWKQS